MASSPPSRPRARRSQRRIAPAALATLAVLAAGCDDAPKAPAPPAPVAADAPPPAAPPAADAAVPSRLSLGKVWLEHSDPMPPDYWLASREAGRDLLPGEPAVREFRVLLDRAGQGYGETARMIANRAVQLESMLRARGVDESARQVIEGLVALSAGRSARNFGETGQHYVTIRPQRASREEALRALGLGDETRRL